MRRIHVRSVIDIGHACKLSDFSDRIPMTRLRDVVYTKEERGFYFLDTESVALRATETLRAFRVFGRRQ